MHNSNNCSLMPIRGYSNSHSWFSGSVVPDPVMFGMLKGLEVLVRFGYLLIRPDSWVPVRALAGKERGLVGGDSV